MRTALRQSFSRPTGRGKNHNDRSAALPPRRAARARAPSAEGNLSVGPWRPIHFIRSVFDIVVEEMRPGISPCSSARPLPFYDPILLIMKETERCELIRKKLFICNSSLQIRRDETTQNQTKRFLKFINTRNLINLMVSTETSWWNTCLKLKRISETV